MRFRPEASEVSKLALDCPKGCAYCCLCPPGLLDGEVEAIVGACEDSALTLGKDRMGDSERAVQVQGDRGACSFLDDRRCKVYKSRPHFCRQYPVMVYSGWRIQLSAIRSCRGLVDMPKGTSKSAKARPLMDLFKTEVEALGEAYFAKTLEETRSCFEEIKDDKGFYASPEDTQRVAMRAANAVGDARAIARTIGLDAIDEAKARTSILSFFWEDIEPAFTCPDIIDLPVYNRPDHGWEIFRVGGGHEMSAYTLLENGKMTYKLSRPVSDLRLRPMEPSARAELRKYLELAFKRDVFYGSVAREAIVGKVTMNEMAVEMAAGIATDIWWRAGLLSVFGAMVHPGKGPSATGPLDARTAKEAVIFMDADLLDSYALGAII